MALVFVDLDGTLTKFDTLIPYCCIALLHRPWRVFAVKDVLLETVRYVRGRTGRQGLKEAFIRAFLGGAPQSRIDRWNRLLFRAVIAPFTRSSVLNRVRNHQREGDRVFIVSASPDVYVGPLARLWGVDGYISTRLERQNGLISGKILGKNCRGEEKVRRIRELFSDEELLGSHAYGNSSGDRQMLELADFGLYV